MKMAECINLGGIMIPMDEWARFVKRLNEFAEEIRNKEDNPDCRKCRREECPVWGDMERRPLTGSCSGYIKK